MADVNLARPLQATDRGLAIVATTRADCSVQCTVVNCGILEHPATGDEVVGFVTRGSSLKLRHLRERPWASVVFRRDWQWVTVEGRTDLIGPHDSYEGIDPEGLRQLRRAVFRAAGGTHEDWDTYDRVMDEQDRTVVLVHPTRVYTNPSRA